MSAGLGRGGIDDHEKGGLVQSQRQQLAQEGDAVAGRAAARTVRRVHQQHGSPFHATAAVNRLRDRQMLDLEGPAPLPELGREQLRLVRRQRGVIVGHDDGAAAHAGQVVVGVDLETGYGEDGGLLFQAPGAAGEVGHGSVAGGLAVAGAADNRDLGQGGHRCDFAFCCLQQQAGAAFAGGIGVVVGIVGEGDKGGGLLYHARGDVGVQVERHDNRQVRPQDLAYGVENVAFRVLLRGGDHGAVHGEDEAVKRERGAQAGQERILQLGVAGIGEDAARDAARGQQGERLRAFFFTDGEDAGDFAVGAG